MPKTTSGTNLEGRIQEIVQQAAAQIAAAVRQNIAEEVTRAIGAGVGEYRPPARAHAAAGTRPRKRPPILCPVAGCGKPGAGPKFGWFCREHNESLSSAEKEAARAASRTRPRGVAAKLAKQAKTRGKAKPVARRKTKAARKRRRK